MKIGHIFTIFRFLNICLRKFVSKSYPDFVDYFKKSGAEKSQIVWTKPQPVKTVGCPKPSPTPANLRILPGSTTEAIKSFDFMLLNL